MRYMLQYNLFSDLLDYVPVRSLDTPRTSRSRLGPPVLTSTPGLQNMAKSASPARGLDEVPPIIKKHFNLQDYEETKCSIIQTT